MQCDGDGSKARGQSMKAETLRVLWIDDDQRFLLAITAFFRGHPKITLLTAQNARKALEMMQTHFFHILVTDLDLPDMGCQEFLDKLRASCQGPTVGIVSARHEPECLKRCRQLLGFIKTKPVDLEEMERLFLALLEDPFYS